MYTLYAGNSEQFVYTLDADPKKAMRKLREILHITRRDLWKLRKEPVSAGYPNGSSKYRIYKHTRVAGIRKVVNTNVTFLIIKRG